jgi:hypothetical protein
MDIDYSKAWIFHPAYDYLRIASYTSEGEDFIMRARMDDLVRGVRGRVERTLLVPPDTLPTESIFRTMRVLWPGVRPAIDGIAASHELGSFITTPRICLGLTSFVYQRYTHAEATDLLYLFTWFAPQVIFLVSYNWHARLYFDLNRLVTRMEFAPHITGSARNSLQLGESAPVNVMYRAVIGSRTWTLRLWE